MGWIDFDADVSMEKRKKNRFSAASQPIVSYKWNAFLQRGQLYSRYL